MSSAMLPPTAIGVGNVLRADDAVGVRVIEGLRARAELDPGALPAGTRLVDGGTLGLDLLRWMGDGGGVVLVDAVRLGGPVGSVSVLAPDALAQAAGAGPGGAPATALGELLAWARLEGARPGSVSVVAVEVDDLGAGLRLTPAVEAAIPAAMDTVRDELRRLAGHPTTEAPAGRASGRLAGATA